MQSKSVIISILTTFIVSPYAVAESFSFADIWRTIKAQSTIQEAARLEVAATRESHSRATNHWQPRVYVDARSYQTNDPGMSFMGSLEQRKLVSSDFNPSSLNHPEERIYTRGSLGLDLPLYEGEMKINQVSMLEHSLNAQTFVSSQIEIEQYSQVAQAFGSIAVLEEKVIKLEGISRELKTFLKNYSIGQKSNPVGYSGFLGLKSLENRISGLTEQYKAQKKALISSLKVLGWNKENWSPLKTEVTDFIDTFLAPSPSDEISNITKTGREGVQAAYYGAEMEKARTRPRLGAFAESYLFNGNRDTSSGYVAGLYVQWSLYDPEDKGRYQEAKLKALALDKRVQAMSEKEISERASYLESSQALRTNLKLLIDSDKLLNEQMKVAITLFRNGSINALQLTEVLNRRTDLIANQTDLEMGLLKNASETIVKVDFKIPSNVQEGGLK